MNDLMMDELQELFPEHYTLLADTIVAPFPADSSRQELFRVLTRRMWTAIHADYLASCYSGPISEVPGMLTDTAFQYYLPAFLRMHVESPGKTDSLLDSLLFALTREPGRLNDLTIQQRSFLKRFLIRHIGKYSYRKEMKIVAAWPE